ncbi:protein FAR1-RELATED SEQUENCE 5-like isoform X4 [Zingiber officinale]|uniref:protein FAR1-RELATED SEQUENCE 5-like isoform X4 n=1 Tax=Zingiber officinale TaxID=94328 RepID=UPI001C4AB136|nr:protein FAR1-RELATED SEQUENCE 5-like isoform X4 [Zingiber officinale]
MLVASVIILSIFIDVPEFQVIIMEGESTSCRHLNFNENEASREGDFDVIDEGLNIETDLDIPQMGLEFDTEEDAYQFYLSYAKKVGFGIRRGKIHNDKSGKLLDRVFYCCAQGKRGKDKRDIYVKASRDETRFGCEAKMKISNRRKSKFTVVQFVKEHNHYLSSPNKTHLYRSHRNISFSAAKQIEFASDVGIPPKASHDLMVRQVGGRENLGFIPEDYKNYLRSKRTINMRVGDTGGVLEYLQKMQFDDPNFFYAIQVDEDDLITNIFWSDAKMRADYANFGDVVCFDTTYRKNNEGRPIALFVGVNYHKQLILFGVALLYDETSLTFEWLFNTLTKAMGEKKPITILTDQDAAMAKALASRWPETHHRLCIWHIYQNVAIHLSGVFSQFRDFAKDFASCVYDFDEEEDFISAWNIMLAKYALEDNDWLRRMYNIKEKWALVYGRQMFCADMTTTQRSESMNSIVKKYVTYKHKFLDFFNHFQRLLDDRRYEELKADFRSSTTVPYLMFPIEILKYASEIYTPEVYKCFQQEWCSSHDSSLEICEDADTFAKYKVTPLKKKHHHIVTLDKKSEKIECSCKKYEFAGILCSHILKIFTWNNIMKIPSQYVLKRWTRKAKIGFFGVNDSMTNNASLDPKVLQNMRYKDLCGLNVQLVTKAAERDDTYKVVKDVMLSLCKMVDDKLQVNESNIQQSKVSQESWEFDYGEGNSTGVKGIKTKKKTISGKRLKGGLEKTSRKRKASSKTNQASTIVMGVDQTISSMAIVQCDRINQQSINFSSIGSSVDNVSMTESQFPPLLASQLSQVHQPSHLGYFPTNYLE